jgi:hypothetical protein
MNAVMASQFGGSRISSLVTENGEQGASTTWISAPGVGS